MFRALLKEQEDLSFAPAPFAVLEMAAVRLATLPEGDDVARLLARLDELERRLGDTGGRGGAGPAPRGPGAAEPDRPRAPRGERRAAPPEPGPALAAPLPAQASPAAAPANGASPGAVFDRLRAFAREQNPGVYAALEGGRIAERSAEALVISVPAFAAQRLRERHAALEEIATLFFGETLRVRVAEQGAVDAASGPDGEAVRLRRQAALNHPGVARALEILEGEILEIRPLGAPR
jgi:DNA polymerase-3 subunit gamma/tau